jgi:nucleoside-diphosphate-sugar epimerase
MFSTTGVYQFRKYGVNGAVTEAYQSGLNKTNAYGNSKVIVEYLIRELTYLGKINGKIIRPGEIFGPVNSRNNDDPIFWKGMIDAAIKGEPFELVNHPEHRLDWVYCKDVANVAVKVLITEGEYNEYHAASGRLTGIYDFKNTLDNLFPSNKISLVNCTIGGWNFPLSVERMKEDLDYEPLFNLERGIEDYKTWYLEHH